MKILMVQVVHVVGYGLEQMRHEKVVLVMGLVEMVKELVVQVVEMYVCGYVFVFFVYFFFIVKYNIKYNVNVIQLMEVVLVVMD